MNNWGHPGAKMPNQPAGQGFNPMPFNQPQQMSMVTPNVEYYIESALNNKKVLDVCMSQNNLGGLIIYDKHNHKQANQVFTFKEVSNGRYMLVSSGKALEVVKKGAHHVLVSGTHNTDTFEVLPAGNGTVLIKHATTGLVLDVPGLKTDNQTAIILYEHNGGNNQHWYLRNA